jgi:NADH:ubiquinone oxidoreductase subunit F (NADH-binding)
LRAWLGHAAEPAGSQEAVVNRLLAGPPTLSGYERLDQHLDRLGALPSGGTRLLDEIAASGLGGRGGAGFPTWRKWAAFAERSTSDSTIVVNASEGEPLSEKDRTLLTFRPHLVLDGAALAADTLGAREIVLYMSRRTRTARRSLEAALRERREARRREPRIRVVHPPDRYVAGESSAVARWVGGGHARPQFNVRVAASTRGGEARPTLVQNVETLAHVAMIARRGSAWFRELGTERSPGSALLTLCGNVTRQGVYEVDLGASLGEVLAAAGGTPSPPGAALLGGYFGTWIGAGALDGLPLDAERLRSLHGASLGCGVVAVLPQHSCGIVEAAAIFAFLAAESAGQCGPCVNGLRAVSETMERVARSRAEAEDVAWIRRWMGMIRGRGACHHPDGAVGQLSSALDVFNAHLADHLTRRPCHGLGAAGFPRPPRPGRGWR